MIPKVGDLGSVVSFKACSGVLVIPIDGDLGSLLRSVAELERDATGVVLMGRSKSLPLSRSGVFSTCLPYIIHVHFIKCSIH